jgi:hypothetical protein
VFRMSFVVGFAEYRNLIGPLLIDLTSTLTVSLCQRVRPLKARMILPAVS